MKHKLDNVVAENDTIGFKIKKGKVDMDIPEQIKLMKQHLKEEDSVFEALQVFFKIISGDEENINGRQLIIEYLRVSPDCKELFSPFIIDKKTPKNLTLAWNILEKILNVLSENDESADVHITSNGYPIVCNILHNHLNILYSSLNIHVVDFKLRSSVLKCMSSMLAQGLQCVREFLKCFDFASCFKQLKECAKVSKKQKHDADARSCFLRFYLAFLVFGDVSVTKRLLEQKDLLFLVTGELHLDKVENILIVLETVNDKIVNEGNMLKTTKLSFFTQMVLGKLVILAKHNDENIKAQAMKLLTTLCTNQKYGICFHGKDEFYTGKLVNPVLLKFLLSVKQCAMMREEIRDLTVETLHTCPDIIAPYINGLNLGFDPRLSDFWCTRLTFLIKIWEGLPKLKDICRTKVCDNKDAILKLTIPHNVTRQLFTQGMKNKVNKVKQTTLQLLKIALTRCVEVKSLLEETCDKDVNNTGGSELLQWVNLMVQMLPDVTPIIGIRQMSALSTETSSPDTSVSQENTTEEMVDIHKGDDQVESSYDPIEMDILLELSMKCLNLYQKLKPGILTISGFNICKLLLFSRPASEDVIMLSLSTLLSEVGGVRTWLEKRLVGPDNIFHLVLQIMISWKKSKEIVAGAKQLFFKILNVTGQFDNYAFEINSWISSLLLFIDIPGMDVDLFVKEFAGACIKTVNEPFLYLENISNLFKKKKSGDKEKEFKLQSPLFFMFVQDMKSEAIIKYAITPVMKDLLITHDTPGFFMEVLLQQIDEDSLPFYEELLCYSSHWMQGLEKDVSFVDSLQSKDIPLQSLSQKASVINKIALALINVKCGGGDPSVTESYLKEIISMDEEIKSFCLSCSVSSPDAIMYFLANIIHFLYNSMNSVPNDLLPELFEMTKCLVRTTVKDFDITNSKKFITNILGLPLFKNLVTINDHTWKIFSQDIFMIFLECCPEVQSMEVLKTYIKGLVAIFESKAAVKESVELFCKFTVYLDEKMLCDIGSDITESLLNHLKEELCDDYLSYHLKILKTIKDIVKQDMNEYKLRVHSCDLTELLYKSIVSKNNFMIDIFLNISSMLEFDGEMRIGIEEYRSLLKLDKIFVNCAVFMSRRNFQIVKREGALVSFNDEFISDIVSGNIPPTTLCSTLMPVLINVLKIYPTSEDHPKFAEALKSVLWKDIVEQLETKSDITVLPVLTVFVPYLSNNEKMDSLGKVKILFKNRCKEEVVAMSLFCNNILLSLADGKEEKLCLLELISALMDTISNGHLQDDSYTLLINTLFSFVSLLLKFETKLKSHCYKSLCDIWIKFVKDTLKSKYDDDHSMSVLLECINIFYKDKRFRKMCLLKIKDLYQYIVSHSKFFEILFSEDITMVARKTVLLKMMSRLAELSDILNPTLVPMLLVAYEAKLSEKDSFILSILQNFEKNEISLSQFYPFFWGSNAVEVYKKRQNANSLLKERSSAEVLQNVDNQVMMKSAIEFPIHLTFNKLQEVTTYNQNYDPLFFLPLFVSLLQPECIVDCFHFMESGCLMFTFAAMSSFDMAVRKLAYCVISSYNHHLDNARFREKSQVIYLLMLLKNSVVEEYMRFPSVWTTFFIQYIYFLLKPDHHLYAVLNQIVLQKAVINTKELPVFTSLFYSCQGEHSVECRWLLELLVGGLKDLSDYYLYKKYHVFELLIPFYDSHVCDKSMRLLIHDIFLGACSLTVAVFDLVKTNSILSWIHNNVREDSNTNKSRFYNLLSTIANAFQRNCDGHSDSGEKKVTVSPKLLLHEISLICEYGIQSSDSLAYKDCVKICSVYYWVQSTTSLFGEMATWQQDSDNKQYLDIVTNLLLNADSTDDQDEVSKLFCNVVLSLLEKDDPTALLESICWRMIYSVCKKHQMSNLTGLFEKLLQWCNKVGNKPLLSKLIHAE